MSPIEADKLLAKLKTFHRDIYEGLDEIKGLCLRPSAPTIELGRARLRLSRISASRTKFINTEVIPNLLDMGDGDLRPELSCLQKAFSEKRLLSSQHVSRWNAAAIEADWHGYRKSAQSIRDMMHEQIKRESLVLASRLQRRNVVKIIN